MRLLKGHNILRHLATTTISFAVVAFFVTATLNISFLNPIAVAFEDFSITDIFYQMFDATGNPRKSKIITIVDMTELRDRSDIAMLIHEIEDLHPKVLGIDMVFEGLKCDSAGDNMIRDVAKEYDNTVYSYKLLNYNRGQYTTEVHSFFTPVIRVTEGFTNFERKLYGGIKREISIGQKTMSKIKPSFSLLTANKYAEEQVMQLEDRQFQINYTPTDFNEISYKEISETPELIEDRIVLLGATKEEVDMHYTPLGKKPGVVLQAYSIETMINQKEIHTASIWEIISITFIMVFLTELIQVAYENYIEKRKNVFIRFFGSTEMALNLLTFLLMFVWLSIFFLLFYWFQYSINLLWAFSGMAFLDTSRQFYDTLIKTLDIR